MQTQTVTLDSPDTQALYVDDADGTTRVFYDLKALLDQYLPAHLQNTLMATVSGDPTLVARALGNNDILEAIAQSASVLTLEHQTGLTDRD